MNYDHRTTKYNEYYSNVIYRIIIVISLTYIYFYINDNILVNDYVYL